MANTLPILFIERINTIFSNSFDVQKAFSPRAWKSFRINTLKTSRQEAWDQLNLMSISFQVLDWYLDAFIVSTDDAKRLLQSSLAEEGKIYAQGLESMLSVWVLDPKPNEKILDLCAAPGSKTSQIAAWMNNEGDITANEPITQRFFRLKSVLELTGSKAQLKRQDGRYFRSSELYDRVLVDAPCSSEGRFVLDDPKSFAYWSLRKIQEMAHKQKGLLLNAGRLLKPGGVLVYSTCTFAPEENEAVVDWFLRKSQDEFYLEPMELPFVKRYHLTSIWGRKEFDHDLSPCLRIFPNEFMEGFFIARFRRRSS